MLWPLQLPSCRSQDWDVRKASRRRSAMLLSQNGLATFTRRGFHGALFSALLAFALFGSEAASAQEMKQIKLTEKYIQGFMTASEDMASLDDGANPDQPDAKVQAQAEAVAKRNGFASLAEYE